jgi:hypothetical protein
VVDVLGPGSGGALSGEPDEHAAARRPTAATVARVAGTNGILG